MGANFSKAHPLSLANHLYARFKEHPVFDKENIEKFVKFILENVDPEATVEDLWLEDHTDKHGCADLKPILLAARFDFLDVVKKLAPKYDIAKTTFDYLGNKRTAIHYAANNGNLEMVKFLMSHVENPMALFDLDVEGMENAHFDGLTSTPIHEAADEGHLEVIKYLIKFTGDHPVNVIGYHSGETPIMLAAGNNHLEVVKFLSQFTENPNEGNADHVVSEFQNRGYTPINMAVSGGHLDVIKFLAPLSNNVNEPCETGQSPLHFAVQFNKPKIVEFLLPYTDHLPFSAQNHFWGQCPFEEAWEDWKIEIIEIFAKFYKARQHRLNPTLFRDNANGRPNGGIIDEDFCKILTNLINCDAFEECHCKGPCKVSELVEFMLRDDSEYCSEDSDDTGSEKSQLSIPKSENFNSDQETLTEESESEEISKAGKSEYDATWEGNNSNPLPLKSKVRRFNSVKNLLEKVRTKFSSVKNFMKNQSRSRNGTQSQGPHDLKKDNKILAKIGLEKSQLSLVKFLEEPVRLSPCKSENSEDETKSELSVPKSENSDCWETLTEESESEEISERAETEYEEACKENPKLRNQLYLSIYCNLK